MITVEIRGHTPAIRVFKNPADAKAFVVDAQGTGNCSLIKYTDGGRSTFFEFSDGTWVVR